AGLARNLAVVERRRVHARRRARIDLDVPGHEREVARQELPVLSAVGALVETTELGRCVERLTVWSGAKVVRATTGRAVRVRGLVAAARADVGDAQDLERDRLIGRRSGRL